MLTSCCRAAAYVFVFVVKLNAHPFAVASGDAAAATPAQRDGNDSVDVGQHDGDTDTCSQVIRSVVLNLKAFSDL